MLRRVVNEGVSTAFNGPPGNRAALDLSHNYPLNRANHVVEMVMAAMRSLGLNVRAPRHYARLQQYNPTRQMAQPLPRLAPSFSAVTYRSPAPRPQ